MMLDCAKTPSHPLTLLFQAVVTALFLLLLRLSPGDVLPWWWDIHKILLLVVGAFWLLQNQRSRELTEARVLLGA